ncbi:DUF6276 family protein [Natronorarus salvus]|uniref:DUF6276 family protein n=1 Tax=Natronorarus salvus TaxID=3117733 RepID=UPI002F26C2E9
MSCPVCGSEVTVVPIPERYGDHHPEEPGVGAVCRRCLTVSGTDSEPTGGGVRGFSDALPADEAAAIGVCVLCTLCSSIALNRARIEAVVAVLERDGIDALSTVERLATDEGIALAFDVDRRRPQLEQIL